jgi:hypothetical protein
MSYFKPLNSNENNLHIIRSTISGNGTILYPSTNQLPSSFNVTSLPSVDGNSTVLTVRYNNVFNSTDIPTIFINSESSLNSTTEIINPTASYYYSQNSANISTSNIANLIPDTLDTINSVGLLSASYNRTTGVLSNPTNTALTFAITYNFNVNSSNIWSSININNLNTNSILEQFIPQVGTSNIAHTATVVIPPLNSIAINLSQNTNYNILRNTSLSPSFVRFTQLDSFASPPKSIYVSEKYNSYCNIFGFNITSSAMPTIDLLLIGAKPTGPVFAVSNRGWKYATNLANDNLLYSDMLVGINTDNPIFNLSHNGNIGFSTNVFSTASVIPSNLLNNFKNVVNIDDANVTVSMPGSLQNGQMVDITIGQVNIINRQLELDISSNILNAFGTNLILRSAGDTVSLMGYNNQWLVINKQTTSVAKSVVNNYNNLYTSSINYDLLLNGYLSIINFDTTINTTINLPVSTAYDGVYVDLVVGQKSITNTSRINLLMGNIISSSDSIVLDSVSDRVKLIGTQNKWLLIQSHLT